MIKKYHLCWLIGFTLAVFALDYLTPVDYAGWLLYILPFFVVGRKLPPRDIKLYSAITTIMIIVGFFVSPPGISEYIAAFNRSLMVVVLWVTGLLVIRRNKAADELVSKVRELSALNQNFDLVVTERTANLEKANEQLRSEINERNRVERLLYEEQERLREKNVQMEELTKLLEYAPVLIRSLSGEIAVWNTGMQSLYGFTRVEAVGKISHRLLRTRFPKPLEEINDALLADGTWQGELQHTTRDGDEITVTSLWVLHRPEAETTAVIEVNNDITKTKRAEEALQRSEKQLRQLAEALPLIVWSAGPDGAVDYLNSSWFKYTGSDVQEPLEDGWAAYLHPDEYKTTLEKWKDSVREGKEYEIEYRLRSYDGTYQWFLVRGIPLYDDGGNVVRWFGSCTNIEAQQRAKEAAEAAARAKTEFMANMSHEIRTPMNGILGMADLLLETEIDALQRQYLDMLKSSGEALLSVVNDVLDFSKLEAGAMALDAIEFDLREAVDKAVENLSIRAYQKGIELTVVVDPELPESFIGDPAKLRQVLLNLVANAVKFTERGEVAVHVDGERTEGESWKLTFCVTDTGIGIPEGKLSMIFESFTQVDTSVSRTYGGTGLGLAISKRIIGSMGGDIWAESTPGKGSAFSFQVELPKVERPRHEEPPEAVNLSGLQALVIDDNATNRVMLQRHLTSKGMLVEQAETGYEALEKANAAADAGHPFDLVFLDMHLPDIDGFKVAESLRSRFSIEKLCIMMITSDDIAGGTRRARELGMAGYLVKPLRTSALNEVLKQTAKPGAETMITGRGPVQPRVAPDIPFCTHVLLAEDNPVNLTVAETILRKAGVRVTAATNGFEAVDAFEHGRFHLILMDVQMPEMDGFEATRLIRVKGSDIPIIGLTAHAMEGDRERCIAAGMDDYLPKPFAAQSLNEKVAYWAWRHPLPAAGVEKLLQMVGGGRSEFDLIVQTFLKNAPPQVEEVKAALEAKDAERLEKAAHKLRGAAAAMDAESARCLAEELEMAAHKRDLPKADALLAALETEIARVLEELSNPK